VLVCLSDFISGTYSFQEETCRACRIGLGLQNSHGTFKMTIYNIGVFALNKLERYSVPSRFNDDIKNLPLRSRSATL
jgi:hypothetical protein